MLVNNMKQKAGCQEIQHSVKPTLILNKVLMTQGYFYKTISLFLRQQRQPTTSQPHQRSCSSGTGFGWTSIRGQTLQVWRRRSNSTQRTTRETARTPTFQRDTWVNVTDTSLLKDSGYMCAGLDKKFYKLAINILEIAPTTLFRFL